jgi:hypothetical protein
MDSLTGIHPTEPLIHGPSKLLVDRFHWHSPQVGIVGSYVTSAKDVLDHFRLFRGVDQIESFGQTVVAAGVYLECIKQRCTFGQFKARYTPVFISLGNVNFHNYIQEGDTIVNIGHIKLYKFRQIVSDGRIYKAPAGLDLDDYFKDFDEQKLLSYDLSKSFILVAEINDITGRTLKKEMLKPDNL